MPFAEYRATFGLSEDAMSLNAISASLATLGLTSTNSSIASVEVLPGNFADFLAAQTLQPPALISSDTQVSSEQSDTGDPSKFDLIFAGESPPIDPSSLAGIAFIPPFNSTITIGSNIQFPDSRLNEEDSTLGADLVGNRLLSLKDSLDSRNHDAASKPNNAIFGASEQQPLSNKTEAANIAADAGNNLTSAANFEPLLNKAMLSPPTGAHIPLTVNHPIASDAWSGQFSEKIVWLVKNDQQSAQININPPQLGPIQITLNLNGDQMNAAFASPNAEVRQAIESAMPQLREMLSTAGISLGDANVGTNFGRQNQDNPFMAGNKTQSLGENAILPADENAANVRSNPVILKGRGLVDLFA